MMTVHRVVLLLRLLLIALFGALVMFQAVIFPGQFRYLADEEPELDYLWWSLLAIGIVGIVCVQVVVVCTWHLLTLVKRDQIFSQASMVWVDTIIWAMLGAWTLGLATFVWVVSQADDPGFPVLLMMMLLCGSVVGLLMVVMRELLRRATVLRTEMESVI